MLLPEKLLADLGPSINSSIIGCRGPDDSASAIAMNASFIFGNDRNIESETV